MQCSRGFNPAGTLHQPESRLPGVGNADTTAAPWLCFVSRRVLQLIDRTACAVRDSRGHNHGPAKTPAPIELFAQRRRKLLEPLSILALLQLPVKRRS